MKTLLERLKRDYERADKKDKDAKKAKLNMFQTLFSALGLRLEDNHNCCQSDMDYVAEKVSADTGYDHAQVTIRKDGGVVVTEIRDNCNSINGVEIIDCREDNQPRGDTLEDFLNSLLEVGSTSDLIDLEAKYPKYTNYPEVSAFIGWCWDEIESQSNK